MNIILQFIEKYLPDYLFKNKEDCINAFVNEEEAQIYITKIWGEFNDINLELPVHITIRNSRNKTTQTPEKMILLKLNSISSNEESFISAVIYLDINNTLKYFVLEEIDSSILPESFIKNNEKFLLKEINENQQVKKWGKILNPRNLSSIISSISLVSIDN